MTLTKVRDCEDCEFSGERSCNGIMSLGKKLPYETKCPDKVLKRTPSTKSTVKGWPILHAKPGILSKGD